MEGVIQEAGEKDRWDQQAGQLKNLVGSVENVKLYWYAIGLYVLQESVPFVCNGEMKRRKGWQGFVVWLGVKHTSNGTSVTWLTVNKTGEERPKMIYGEV